MIQMRLQKKLYGSALELEISALLCHRQSCVRSGCCRKSEVARGILAETNRSQERKKSEERLSELYLCMGT